MKRLFLLIVLSALPMLASAQRWAISTNALDYINFGTLNIEGDVAVSRHVVLDIGAKFNPWSFGNRTAPSLQKQNRQRTFYAGAKWYPWFIYDGWHFDVSAGYREYNTGGIFSQKTEEGDMFGGGVGFGYTLPVHKNVNLDFGAGFWMGRKAYTVYSCPTCGKMTESGAKFFLMPQNVMIGVAWVFGEDLNKEKERKR